MDFAIGQRITNCWIGQQITATPDRVAFISDKDGKAVVSVADRRNRSGIAFSRANAGWSGSVSLNS